MISEISRKKQVLNAIRLHMRSIWMRRSVTGSPVRRFLFTGRINFRFLTETCLPAPGIFRESLGYLRCCQNILTDMMPSGWNWRWIVVPGSRDLCSRKVPRSPTVRKLPKKSSTSFSLRASLPCRRSQRSTFPSPSNRCG